MKKLLLPFLLILLASGMVANNVIADNRFILGSFERLTETSDAPFLGDNVSVESTLNGISGTLYLSQNDGFYSAIGLGHMVGDSDVCVQSNCASVDTKFTTFSCEIGWNLGKWIPFVGPTWTQAGGENTEVLLWDSENNLGHYPHIVVERSADPFYLKIGLWLELDSFKVRGFLTGLDDSDTRGVSGAVLYQMENKFVVGAEFNVLLDSEADGFRFSLQFGRSF
ncbi:MAG: hypothetical protein F4W92_08435 [Gammaproteobacteria bacterium]|nr:hypothetical protein [Gammaproteobacteria bacterium]